jgi:hypothetical protein
LEVKVGEALLKCRGLEEWPGLRSPDSGMSHTPARIFRIGEQNVLPSRDQLVGLSSESDRHEHFLFARSDLPR